MNVDLSSPTMQHNPYPAYAEMRHDPALATINNRFLKQTYMVTRYEDVSFVLKDPRFFNDMRKLPDRDDWSTKWYIPAMLKAFASTMALADEPEHTRLRSLVHKAFTPAMIQKMAGKVEEISNDLLDKAARKPVIDFMGDFALPLPLAVIGDIMGVSEKDRMRFHRYMANSLATISPHDRLSLVPKMLNALGLERLVKGLIADRRRTPKDDLTSALVQAQDGGDRLSEVELVSMLFLILFAGHETTVNLLGSGTLALLQNRGQLDKLAAHPELMDTAIEELLRYTNPVQHIAIRYASEDVKIGENDVPKYSSIMVNIAAANRDETVFENPEQLDITRNPNKHVAFGFGIHYCLGAPLARLEASIAFNTLFKRYPKMQLAVPEDHLKWRGAPSLRGLVNLPIRLNG